MPKVARTPPKPAEEGGNREGKEKDKEKDQSHQESFAAMLIAMEERLSSKLDANKRAVNEAVKMSKLNSDTLDALEEKVDATDEILKETLARVEAQEERVLARVESQVKELVREQLKEAGFDSQLSAGDLPSIQEGQSGTTYAAAASKSATSVLSRSSNDSNMDGERRRENKFWQCRRSLRLWPIKRVDVTGVKEFLMEKLDMDERFVEHDMGPVVVRRSVERKQKNKDEVCVEFENKQIRDLIKAQGPNLAKHREEAGMRLQIPDGLQKDFKALMALAYDLKQTHKELKRNVKFDEENLGLFMDVQTEKDGTWKRIRPHQAYKTLKTRRNGPEEMEEDEIKSLLGEQSE